MPRVLYTGDPTFAVVEHDVRPPGPGEVRIDVAYTGICGTDLHIRHGAMDARVHQPAVLGHEMAGRLADLGDGVSGWAAGDPVTVIPLEACHRCPACLAGHSHICHHLNFVGIDSPGSLQTSWTVPARLLARLPSELSLRHAALIEPVAVAVHDVRRAGPLAEQKVVVVGGGPIGLLIARVATIMGADVLLLELDERRRATAQRLGLVAVNPTAEDVPALVDDWTSGAGAAVTFEVSGSAAGVATATDVLATRGRLVMVAIHPTPREVDLFRLFWRELTVIGARVYERRDVEHAVDLLARGDIPAEDLITRVVPIEQVNEAFDALERGEEVKVLIDCHGVPDA
jgi:(R,R)-butanediol dehydrogenase / meso-butanediol dehydrogenase / diacetyl reductase